MAPAPIEEMVTKTPINAPTRMVAIFMSDPLGRKFLLFNDHFKTFCLNNNEAPVSSTEIPIEI